MTPRALMGSVAVLAAILVPAAAMAEGINFKPLRDQSRETFKSGAPLETFVGNAAGEGVDGTLAVDPAKPQEAKASVKVDMHQVRTGIEKRDMDMRGKIYLDSTEVDANRWVTFEVKSVEI